MCCDDRNECDEKGKIKRIPTIMPTNGSLSTPMGSDSSGAHRDEGRKEEQRRSLPFLSGSTFVHGPFLKFTLFDETNFFAIFFLAFLVHGTPPVGVGLDLFSFVFYPFV